MYRKEENTIRFYYKRDTLFNDVSLLSNFMAKNLATKEGNSLTDEFAISEDEKDLFGVCVQQTLPDIYEAMAKITAGVSNAFEDAESGVVAKAIVLANGASLEGFYLGSATKDTTYVNPYYLEDGTSIIYLKESPEASGTASGETTVYSIADEYVSFLLQDNAAYNDNILTLVDASLYNAIKQGVLKEFYSTVVQADFFKLCTERFLGELFKLKQRLFQLKKKSVVSNIG